MISIEHEQVGLTHHVRVYFDCDLLGVLLASEPQLAALLAIAPVRRELPPPPVCDVCHQSFARTAPGVVTHTCPGAERARRARAEMPTEPGDLR